MYVNAHSWVGVGVNIPRYLPHIDWSHYPPPIVSLLHFNMSEVMSPKLRLDDVTVISVKKVSVQKLRRVKSHTDIVLKGATV